MAWTFKTSPLRTLGLGPGVQAVSVALRGLFPTWDGWFNRDATPATWTHREATIARPWGTSTPWGGSQPWGGPTSVWAHIAQTVSTWTRRR